MTSRVRVALLAITALVMVPGVIVGFAMPNDVAPASTSIVDAGEAVAAPFAVPVRTARPAVPRGLPQAAVIVTIVAAVRFSLRRRSLRGLLFRLGDVGDRWRALLFGAPPSLL
jgi:hypothetical protein